jgi:protein ImuB
VVPAGEAAAFLAPFPVAALEVADVPDLADLVDLFQRLGLRTLGHLAALRPADVLARFGPLGAMAHALASGADPRAPDARRPPPDLVEQAEFEPPVGDAGPVAFTAKRLADHLHARLEALGLACCQVVVRVETEHGERHERAWRHEAAFRPAAIAERVRWQLEGWAQGPTAPTGGIVLLRLTPAEVVADSGRQLGFWGGRTEADDRALRAAARLSGVLGLEAVTVPAWRGGRDPQAVVAVPAATVDLEARQVGPPPGAGPWPGRLPTPSPATVLDDRRPAVVADARGQVVTVSGRGMVSAPPATLAVDQRAPRRVVGWAGPWPVEERWWDHGRHRRLARFQLLTDDGTGVLAVVEGGRWWIEARYD